MWTLSTCGYRQTSDPARGSGPRCSLRVYGKGRKERILPLRGPVLVELRLFLSTDLPHVRRPPEPDDFLLFPTKKVYDGRGAEGQQLRAISA